MLCVEVQRLLGDLAALEDSGKKKAQFVFEHLFSNQAYTNYVPFCMFLQSLQDPESPYKILLHKIISILNEGPASFDSLLLHVNVKPEELLTQLAEMEIDRVIRKYPGNYFALIKR